MIASDFTEIVLIDDEITQLQSQLSQLYERRRSILHPVDICSKRQHTTSRIDLSSIDISIDSHPSLSLTGAKHKK